jgi:hypothetical protein
MRGDTIWKKTNRGPLKRFVLMAQSSQPKRRSVLPWTALLVSDAFEHVHVAPFADFHSFNLKNRVDDDHIRPDAAE